MGGYAISDGWCLVKSDLDMDDEREYHHFGKHPYSQLMLGASSCSLQSGMVIPEQPARLGDQHETAAAIKPYPRAN